MKTQCNYCGETSTIQNEGNGCHTCQRGWMIAIKSLIVISTILLGFTLADARCNNSYVCDSDGNCDYQDVCDSTMDLPSTNFAPPPTFPSMDLKPLPSLSLPPIGTSECEYMQVNGRWRNVCR